MGNKKGYIPWNKGLTGFKHSGSFKKGHAKGFAGHKHTEESKKRIGNSRKGCKHPLWKGGRIIDKKGYILLHTPHHPNCSNLGYVPEHRLVMEKNIGRFLNPEEVVHHINEIKDDNKIENLELFKNGGDHTKFHNLNP